jgi:hypothetical protein
MGGKGSQIIGSSLVKKIPMLTSIRIRIRIRTTQNKTNNNRCYKSSRRLSETAHNMEYSPKINSIKHSPSYRPSASKD